MWLSIITYIYNVIAPKEDVLVVQVYFSVENLQWIERKEDFIFDRDVDYEHERDVMDMLASISKISLWYWWQLCDNRCFGLKS